VVSNPTLLRDVQPAAFRQVGDALVGGQVLELADLVEVQVDPAVAVGLRGVRGAGLQLHSLPVSDWLHGLLAVMN
jgi:hypothetical protein